MKAMLLTRTASVEEKCLELADLPTPKPKDNEILVKVSVCGACHTDLDEVEGRLTPTQMPVVPGHQIVGTVNDKGKSATRFAILRLITSLSGMAMIPVQTEVEKQDGRNS